MEYFNFGAQTGLHFYTMRLRIFARRYIYILIHIFCETNFHPLCNNLRFEFRNYNLIGDTLVESIPVEFIKQVIVKLKYLYRDAWRYKTS